MLNLLNGLNHWQIDFLAMGLLLQGAVFAVFPEEVIILTMGLLWGQGRVTFPEALIFIQLGLLPANLAMVLIGKYLGNKKFLQKKRVREALQYLHRYGGGLIFVTRFVPLVRAPVYLAVGIAQYAPLSFVRIDAWASCFQISSLLLVGRWVGTHSESVMDAYKHIGALIASVMAVFLVILIARRRLDYEIIPRGGRVT